MNFQLPWEVKSEGHSGPSKEILTEKPEKLAKGESYDDVANFFTFWAFELLVLSWPIP